jgi:outer membrane lipoprotein-sorting protein
MTFRIGVWAGAVLVFFAAAAAAADSATPALSAVAAAVSSDQSATVANARSGEPAVDPDLDRVLRRVEKAGDEVQRIECAFDYEYNEQLIDEHTWRTGKLQYLKPNRFRIEFSEGGKEAFRFDGRVYVEDRPVQKARYVYRMRNQADPEITDLDIDKVPFPLPFGQKRDKVLKTFTVTYGGPKALEPWAAPAGKSVTTTKPDTKKYDYLDLKPKKGTSIGRNYRRIEMWIDQETGLPRQIRMEDPSDRILTVRFGETRLNNETKIEDKLFEEGPLPEKWERNYQDQTEGRASSAGPGD